MRLLKLLLSSFLLLISTFIFAQAENTWTKRASFGGLKREKAVSFSIGDLGYVSCGVDTAEITHNDLWSYDPTLDTWTQLASIPASPRRNAIAFAISGKGYIGTGIDLDDGEFASKLNDFWEYNPIANSWDEKASYPGGGDTGIYQATAFSVLDKGYIACGKIGSDNYITEMWQYDPLTDVWTPRTPFPGGDRYQLVSFVIENRAYVGMGTDHDVFRKDMHEYNPLTNTWEDAPEFPASERSLCNSFSIGSNGFIVFGSDGGLKDELWQYNYYTQSWTLRANFPGGGRKSAIAFAINNKGYAGLGKEDSGKKQTFYEYNPAGPLSIIEFDTETISVYPNPIKDIATVNLPSKLNKGKYEVYNLNGKLLDQNTFNNTSFQLNAANLAIGINYLIIFNEFEVPVGSKKIMVL